jgi:hypothetical protein
MEIIRHRRHRWHKTKWIAQYRSLGIMDETLKAALEWHERGIAVIPIPYGKKEATYHLVWRRGA